MAKVMVSLPEDLLARIDQEAERRAVSRSALLAEAARRELSRPDPARVAEAIVRSERRFARAGSFDAADLVQADRHIRR
jgi:predicted transcriptional regulator